MKKRIIIVLIAVLVLLTICLGACAKKTTTQEPELSNFTGISFEDLTVDYDGKEHTILCAGVPDGASVAYANNKGTEDGEYNATATISKEGYNPLELSAKLKIRLTEQQVINARSASASNAQQNYDFKINLAVTTNLGGFQGTANANYDGCYRYNSTTNDLSFKRQTSGLLLYDSISYIYNTGSSKIKIVADQNNVAKRTSIVPQQEEELNLLNIPFVAIINHAKANNLSNITKLTTGEYKYKATLALASDNIYVQKIIESVGKLGTTLEIGDATFSNPASGVDFFFNLSGDKSKLDDYKFSISITVPIKGVKTTIAITYQQKANSTKIVIPSTTGIITDSSTINNEITTINNALTSLKNSDTYSLDLEAINEFDPGWKTPATVDKYYSRLYKNINEGRTDFNQSFEYKAHSEEDGAETYKYTYGNIQDGSVHLVSRKGTNTITPASDITVDTQFDYMTRAVAISVSGVDCIKKTMKGGSTLYNVYLKTIATLAVKDGITEMINSNEAEGVIEVDNYFNSNKYLIKDSSVVVEMKGDTIVSVKTETEIRYNPTGGTYTEEQITLSNTAILTVNAKLDKASEYKAPKNTKTTFGSLGLNNVSYYIR